MRAIVGIMFGGAMCVAICAGVSLRLAYASADVDCSKLSKWKSGKDYRKGDLVWFKPKVENRGWEYRCNSSSCHSQPDQHSNWTVVAECKAATDPK